VVVAAAGNDYFLYKKRTQPRLPADYDTVLCVVAADRDGRIANYSNRADVPFTGNGVATYGGQGVRSTRKGGVQAVEVPDGPPDDRDAVVGLYTRFDQVGPHQGPDESSGWAYWSGTSFATPIISGIAANLLAANQLARRNGSPEPLLTPRGVMGRILAMAAPTGDREMGCPYLHVAQRRFITS
jgi:subtilisin family serine protease